MATSFTGNVCGVACSLTGRAWRWRGGNGAIDIASDGSGDALITQLLLARGIAQSDIALHRDPRLKGFLPDPSEFRDMDVAADRLAQAVLSGERVTIYGDYDVDGATSAALMIRFLRMLGLPAGHYIPDRLLEGYGPSGEALVQLAREGSSLIVTVDCGAMAYEALTAAQDAGVDVIVVDHHKCAAELPPAAALVNPNRLDESPVGAAHGHLAAVGVAFLLAIATTRVLRQRGFFDGRDDPDLISLLDLVALGTVADGGFAWPPMDGGNLSRRALNYYLDLFYAFGQAVWPSFVGGAFPGFHDIYAEANEGPSYGFLDARDGATFTKTLNRAVNEGAPLIQLVTWNDFGEGTNIEPAEEYGYRYLETVQQVAHELAPLPYAAADLELPLLIYQLRQEVQSDSADDQRIDEAVDFLLQGESGAARAVLTDLASGHDAATLPAAGVQATTFPNPAHDEVFVAIEARSTEHLVITVYDLLGREVDEFYRGTVAPGRHVYAWDAGAVSSGLYLIRVEAGGGSHTRTVTVRH